MRFTLFILFFLVVIDAFAQQNIGFSIGEIVSPQVNEDNTVTFKLYVGYKFKSSTGYSNELERIDIKNGNAVWRRNLNRDYGWNDVFYTNDSNMILFNAGLHATCFN